jgi:UDP-N-acetylmuramoyl-tripeptide--D-alanyl-D-alanine ligase
VVTYGFAADADIRAESVESAGLDGMRFTLVAGRERHDAAIPTLGRLAVHNALAAAAVGLAAGLDARSVVAALGHGWSAPHRGAIVRAGGVTIVDDSYNASPASVEAALELLAGLPGRRVAVLGEMLELGDTHEAGHEQAGAAAAGIVERLVVVGDGAAGIARGARAAGLPSERIAEVGDRQAALDELVASLAPGDVVLIKASRGIALDLLVDDLRAALEAGR